MSEQEWPELRDEEHEITPSEFDGDERAWRNVHPNHHHAGTLTSQIYEPSDADQGLRSTARELRIACQAHYSEYTAAGKTSVGVCSVTLSEIQGAGLRWVDDSHYVEDVTGHASIDFRTPDPQLHSLRQRKKLAKRLARAAQWAYRVE